MTLNGYDYDGVLSKGTLPEDPYVVITGRTIVEYDSGLRQLAQKVPVYLRGGGTIGDHAASGQFKADIITWLGVTTFYEDNAIDIAVIERWCPDCTVIKV